MRLNQRDNTNNVWPISGCKNSKKIIGITVIKLKKYLTYLLGYFSDVSIIDSMIIKNGLSISIGWNLGKKNISNHLLEPLTSTPIKGTNIREIRHKANKKFEILNRLSWCNDEKKIIKKTLMQI